MANVRRLKYHVFVLTIFAAIVIFYFTIILFGIECHQQRISGLDKEALLQIMKTTKKPQDQKVPKDDSGIPKEQKTPPVHKNDEQAKDNPHLHQKSQTRAQTQVESRAPPNDQPRHQDPDSHNMPTKTIQKQQILAKNDTASKRQNHTLRACEKQFDNPSQDVNT